MDENDPRWWIHGLPSQDVNDWRDGEPDRATSRNRDWHRVPSFYCEMNDHKRCTGTTAEGRYCFCHCHKKEAA